MPFYLNLLVLLRKNFKKAAPALNISHYKSEFVGSITVKNISLTSDSACTNVMWQNITHSNPKNNSNKGPKITNPNTKAVDSHKARLSAALSLGLWILDSALHLTQHSIIKDLAQGAARRYSLCTWFDEKLPEPLW